MRAGNKYGHYECDFCHDPIGELGYVRVGRVNRFTIVKTSECAECHRKRCRPTKDTEEIMAHVENQLAGG